jgi:hypothetical protein
LGYEDKATYRLMRIQVGVSMMMMKSKSHTYRLINISGQISMDKRKINKEHDIQPKYYLVININRTMNKGSRMEHTPYQEYY